jgi:hypothetical protein
MNLQQTSKMFSCTMHFGPLLPSNIYPVGLTMELAGTKVLTVKH